MLTDTEKIHDNRLAKLRLRAPNYRYHTIVEVDEPGLTGGTFAYCQHRIGQPFFCALFQWDESGQCWSRLQREGLVRYIKEVGSKQIREQLREDFHWMNDNRTDREDDPAPKPVRRKGHLSLLPQPTDEDDGPQPTCDVPVASTLIRWFPSTSEEPGELYSDIEGEGLAEDTLWMMTAILHLCADILWQSGQPRQNDDNDEADQTAIEEGGGVLEHEVVGTMLDEGEDEP